MPGLLIRDARVLDPETKEDAVRDLWLVGGAIAESGEAPDRVIHARGLLAMPGFVDPHVHLREPGGEEAETIETGCLAALAGGFTTIVAMPNTRPPLDTPETVRGVLETAGALGLARVAVLACATRGREGREMTDIPALAAAGAIGVTDDGTGVPGTGLARQVMAAAKASGLVFSEHCEDADLSGDGVMHAGDISRRLGLPGVPAEAEVTMVARDLALAESLDARVHLQHISTAHATRLIRDAKASGVRVTAEATPHHLALCDEDVGEGDPDFKMNPPLRGRDDMQALQAALAEGVIDCVATDHAPHTRAAKAKGFRDAPCGVIGLETAFAVLWTELVAQGVLSPLSLAARMGLGPARAFGLPGGSLAVGAPADVTLVDPEAEWVVEPERFFSASRNCPFAGRRLRGRIVATIVGGDVRFELEAAPGR